MVAKAVATLCVLVLASALAGCTASSGKSSSGTSTPADFSNLALEATPTTGVIRGVVVDEAIRPLANATVAIARDPAHVTTTKADGVFGFDNLAPGTYFLQIKRVGYLDVQQSAEVVAGVAEPKAVRVQLTRDASFLAYVEATVYDGFIECTTSILVLCGAPNVVTGDNVTNDRFAWDAYFAANASLIQAEMVWQSTQALSPGLYFEMENLDGKCDPPNTSFLNNTQGESPIYATVNASMIAENKIGPDCPIWMSIFSLGPVCSPETPPSTPVVGALSHCPGFTLEQRFTMYMHAFHGYLPPTGWRFAVDGEPPAPPS